MTPKEKAKELFDKYVELSGIFVGDYESEKEMCLICVDEMLDLRNKLYVNEGSLLHQYLLDVKKEIQLL